MILNVAGITVANDSQIPDAIPRRQHVAHRAEGGGGAAAARQCADPQKGRSGSPSFWLMSALQLHGDDRGAGEDAEAREDIDQPDLAQDAVPSCRRFVDGRLL